MDLSMRPVALQAFVTMVALLCLPHPPAWAEPLPSRFTLSCLPSLGAGLDIDLGIGGSSLRIGGLAQAMVPYSTNPVTPTLTGWGGFTVHRSNDSALDLMIGVNYSTEPGVAFIGTPEKQTNYGLLVAVSYFVDSPRFWMRFTPQYVFPLEGLAAYPGYLKAGIPLVEVGVRVQPWLSLAVGASSTPLRVVVEL